MRTARSGDFALNIVRFLALLPAVAAATVSAQPPHPFVCTDYSQGKVFIVNSAGRIGDFRVW